MWTDVHSLSFILIMYCASNVAGEQENKTGRVPAFSVLDEGDGDQEWGIVLEVARSDLLDNKF